MSSSRAARGPGAVTPLLVLGTRTFASEVADLASSAAGVEVVAFVENLDRDRCLEPLEGLPVRWVDDLTAMAPGHLAVCALSTPGRRLFVEQVAALGIGFATLVHPSATVSATSALGEGVIVGAAVVVASHTTVGRHVVLNRGALIGHHTRIDDYVTIQPGANVAGLCHVGEAAYIGMGAVVRDRIRVGSGSVVGAGAVVVEDVPAGAQVVGVPARVVEPAGRSR